MNQSWFVLELFNGTKRIGAYVTGTLTETWSTVVGCAQVAKSYPFRAVMTRKSDFRSALDYVDNIHGILEGKAAA